MPMIRHYNQPQQAGYTLVELVVAVGLFAVVMLLASGAYFMMINLNRQVQGISTGINNLSFALETMTRTIRTGTAYGCGVLGGDCPSGGTSFSVTDTNNSVVRYTLANGVILQNNVALTDPSVSVSSLTFFTAGTGKPPGDYQQPYVTILITGTVSYGEGKPPKSFSVETGAVMRGSDL